MSPSRQESGNDESGLKSWIGRRRQLRISEVVGELLAGRRPHHYPLWWITARELRLCDEPA
jgi:hypothetical protein